MPPKRRVADRRRHDFPDFMTAPMAEKEILVVDDDPAVRTMLTALLQRFGFTVEVAGDGKTGVDKMRRKSYAAILLDLMLPNMNGFEIIRWLKSDRPLLLKHVIVLTAAANRTLAHFDDQRDVFSLVRKPFDIGDLVDQVRACASQSDGYSNSDACAPRRRNATADNGS